MSSFYERAHGDTVGASSERTKRRRARDDDSDSSSSSSSGGSSSSGDQQQDRQQSERKKALQQAQSIEADSRKEFENKFREKYMEGTEGQIYNKGSIITKRGGSKEFYIDNKLVRQYTPEGKQRITTGEYTDPRTGETKQVRAGRSQRSQSQVSRQRRAEREYYEAKEDYKEQVKRQRERQKEQQEKAAQRQRMQRIEQNYPSTFGTPTRQFAEQQRIQETLQSNAPYSREYRQRLQNRLSQLQETRRRQQTVPTIPREGLRQADLNVAGQSTMRRQQNIPQITRSKSTVTTTKSPDRLRSVEQKLKKRSAKVSNEGLSRYYRQILGTGVGVVSSVRGTGEFLKTAYQKPVQTAVTSGRGLYKVVSGQRSFPKVGRALRQRPGYSTGFFGGEIATDYAFGAGFKKAFTTGETGASFIRGGYRRTKSGIVDIDDTRSLRIADEKFDVKEPIGMQARRAGREVQPVSAQRGLFDVDNPQNVVLDKPKPTPTSPELERAFFADPESRFRTSRAGLRSEKRGGFFDRAVESVTEPITLRQEPKPQAIYFDEQRLQNFPESMSDVERSLRRGGDLTPDQARRLEQFQLRQTGEFSPVGFVSRESEITAAPGDVLVPERTGFTRVRGRPVGLYKTTLRRGDDIGATASRTRRYSQSISRTPESAVRPRAGISQALRGGFKVSSRPVSSVSPLQARSTLSGFSRVSQPRVGTSGISTSISSPTYKSSYSISGTRSSGVSRAGGDRSVSSGIRSPSGISPSGSGFSGARGGATSITPHGGTSGGTAGGIGSSAGSGRKTRTIFQRTRDRSRKRKVPGYNVFVRLRGEDTKINERPLPRGKALNTMASNIDTTPRASGRIQKTGNKITKRGRSRPINRKLFKQFYTKDTKKKKRYVEKNKFRINSPGELKGITHKGLLNRRK